MRSHKSLKAWQEAHQVVNATLDWAESHWRPSLKGVYSQLTSAALSVQINIAEGYGLGTAPLFNKHLRIAYGSSIETADLIELLVHRNAIPMDQASAALEHCQNSQQLLMGLQRKYRHE